jgi:hypothetical protein
MKQFTLIVSLLILSFLASSQVTINGRDNAPLLIEQDIKIEGNSDINKSDITAVNHNITIAGIVVVTGSTLRCQQLNVSAASFKLLDNTRIYCTELNFDATFTSLEIGGTVEIFCDKLIFAPAAAGEVKITKTGSKKSKLVIRYSGPAGLVNPRGFDMGSTNSLDVSILPK